VAHGKQTQKMTLRVRVAVAIVCLLIPVLMISIEYMYSFAVFTETLHEVVEESVMESRPLLNLLHYVQEADLEAHDFLAYGTESEKEEYMKAASSVAEALEATLEAPYADITERNMVRSAYIQWKVAHNLILSQMHGEHPGIELKQMRIIDKQFKDVEEALSNAIQRANLEMEEEYESAIDKLQFSLGAVILFALLQLAVAFFIWRWLVKVVTAPIASLTGKVKTIGTGTQPEEGGHYPNDEVGRLARAVNDTAERVYETTTSLKDMAEHDKLTGLYNHHTFIHLLGIEVERSLRYERVLTLLLIDIDHFKNINDTYGHLAGDEALKQLVSIIIDSLRSIDIAGRYGGDEFAIIMPETPGIDAYSMAERIRLTVNSQQVKLPEGQMVSVGLSIGLAEFPADKVTVQDIVGAADAALYEAKRLGRNKVEVEPGLKAKL